MFDVRRNVRQSDIAREAGVSQATVSLVLHGSDRISSSTRDRVLSVIRQQSYSPNAAARSLRRGRSNLVGVYTYAPVFPVSSTDYFHTFLLGVEREAVNRGNDLVLFTSTEGADGRRHIYAGGENKLMIADGAVILGVDHDADELARLTSENYPFVFIGRRDIDGVTAPYVTADYRSAAGDVADLVYQHGHRKVAYLAGSARRDALVERWAGFSHRARELPLEVHGPIVVRPADLTPQTLTQLLASGVTCLLVETSDLAERVAALAVEIGISIPQQLSAVFLDVGPREWGEQASSLGVPRELMGRTAVDLLLRLVDREAIEPAESVVLPCAPPSSATLRKLPNP